MNIKYIFQYIVQYLNKNQLFFLLEVIRVKMIYELSFVLAGGVNLGLERSWKIIESLMKRYPHATWKKIIDWKKGQGKYIVEVE